MDPRTKYRPPPPQSYGHWRASPLPAPHSHNGVSDARYQLPVTGLPLPPPTSSLPASGSQNCAPTPDPSDIPGYINPSCPAKNTYGAYPSTNADNGRPRDPLSPRKSAQPSGVQLPQEHAGDLAGAVGSAYEGWRSPTRGVEHTHKDSTTFPDAIEVATNSPPPPEDTPWDSEQAVRGGVSGDQSDDDDSFSVDGRAVEASNGVGMSDTSEDERPVKKGPREESSAAYMRLINKVADVKKNPYMAGHGKTTTAWRAILDELHGHHDFTNINVTNGIKKKVDALLKWHKGKHDMQSRDGNQVAKWLSEGDQWACRGLLERIAADKDNYKGLSDAAKEARRKKDIEDKEAGDEIVEEAMRTGNGRHLRKRVREDESTKDSAALDSGNLSGGDDDQGPSKRQKQDNRDFECPATPPAPRYYSRRKHRASSPGDDNVMARMLEHLARAEEARDRRTDQLLGGMQQLASSNMASADRLTDVLSRLA